MQTKKAVGYIRYDSGRKKHVDSVESVEHQEKMISHTAKITGLTVDQMFGDDCDHAVPVFERHGFSKMMKHMTQAGISIIIVESGGRIARKTLPLLLFQEFIDKEKMMVLASDMPFIFKLERSLTENMMNSIMFGLISFLEDNGNNDYRSIEETL